MQSIPVVDPLFNSDKINDFLNANGWEMWYYYPSKSGVSAGQTWRHKNTGSWLTIFQDGNVTLLIDANTARCCRLRALRYMLCRWGYAK